MKKVKIAQIITRLDWGGSADVVQILCRRISPEFYDVCLIIGETKYPTEKTRLFLSEFKGKTEVIEQLKRNISFLNDVYAFFKIYLILRREKVDIVHTHTSKAGILGRWAAKLAGVKIIVHSPHGHIFYGYFGWLKTQIFIFLEKITSLITDKIITLTEIGKQDHIRYRIAKPKKFVPIYSGVEIERFTEYKVDTQKEKQRLNISEDVPIIGTITRLDPIKGNRYFIEALPYLKRSFPRIKVFIVGDGSEKSELEKKANELGLRENVVFMGYCADVRPVLALFDVFTLASLNEGMGMCLVEAQAMGVPVVATKVGGVPEVVKDGITGKLVMPNDAKALAAAIGALLQDKTLREKMSKAARKWADEKFNAEIMIEKITALYSGLINNA